MPLNTQSFVVFVFIYIKSGVTDEALEHIY